MKALVFVISVSVLLTSTAMALTEEQTEIYECFAPHSKSKEDLPAKLLDGEYNTHMTLRNLVANTETYITNIGWKDHSAVQVHSDKHSAEQWIFVEDTATYVQNYTQCQHVPDWPTSLMQDPTPLRMPQAVRDFDSNVTTWRSLPELLAWVQDKTNVSWSEDLPGENATEPSLYPPHKLWTGCMPVYGKDKTKQMSVRIGYLSTDSKYVRPDVAVGVVQPLYVQVLVYENAGGDKVTVDVDQTYDVSKFSADIPAHQKTKMFATHPGVFCEPVVNSTRVLPTMPAEFTAAVRYHATGTTKITHDMLIYAKNDDKAIFACTYNGDIPLAQQAAYVSQPTSAGTVGAVRVIHDHTYGLEYSVNRTTDLCQDIARLADGVTGDQENGTLRDAFDLLVRIDASEFTWLTTRTLECGATADVFSAKTSGDKATTIVTDLYYVNATDGTPQLNKIATYTYTETTTEVPQPSVLYIDSIRPTVTVASPWTHLNVAPCLETTSDGYVMANVHDTDMKALTALGMQRVREAIVETLAQAANVSAFRVPVDEVYLKATTSSVIVLFTITSPSAVAPSTDYRHELTVEEAVDNLNATLHDDDLVIHVTKTQQVKLASQSLAKIPGDIYPPVIPPTPAPEPQPSSGGSGGYFALAICMLIVGGIAGVLGAWWMWKRNRSGIAYQIYE